MYVFSSHITFSLEFNGSSIGLLVKWSDLFSIFQKIEILETVSRKFKWSCAVGTFITVHATGARVTTYSFVPIASRTCSK